MAAVAWTCALLGVVYWAITVGAQLRTVRALRRIDDAASPGAGTTSLSIIVAARDEADTFRHELEVLEALDHPDLELVLVDDRSSDDTGRIMDALAAADPRVRVVHVQTLPDGWLGKVHALERGRQVARGRWLLLTDADVELAPQLPRRAIATAERLRLDQLALLPVVRSDGLLVAGVVATFARWLLVGTRLWRAADPERPEAFGVGACNLVRASTLERVGGLESIRMDIADDAALAQQVAAAGGRTMLASGVDLVEVRWQRSVASMVQGFEKYGGSGGIGSVPGAIALVSLALVGELAPWIAIVLGVVAGMQAVVVVAALTMLLATVVAIGVARRAGAPTTGVAAGPIGPLLVWWMQVRAAVLEQRRGGVVWRGTFYSTESVRAGKRYQLPIGRGRDRA